MSFELIKQFYELKLWNKEQLKQLIGADIITSIQYEEITGENINVKEII